MEEKMCQKVEQDLPNKSPSQLTSKVSSTSLQDLPDEVIQEIFAYGSPYNILPLVNSYFNKLLKFDPQYKGDREWRNSSLVLEIIKTNYLVSLNEKLDFNEIQRSIDSFKGSIQRHERKYSNSPYVHKMKSNLAMFDCNILKFRKQKYGLSSYALNHKTMSVGILDQVESRFPGVVIHLPQILKMEVEMRLNYCQFSCSITSLYNEISKAVPENDQRTNNARELSTLKKIRRFLYPYLQLENLKSPLIITESGLDHSTSIIKCKIHIPRVLHRHGIYLVRQWEPQIREVRI